MEDVLELFGGVGYFVVVVYGEDLGEVVVEEDVF